MKRILQLLPAVVGASAYYRTLLPHRHCKAALREEGIELELAETIKTGEAFDAIILYRESNLAFIQHANHKRWDGCKFIWDTDDDHWNIPEWSGCPKDLGIKQVDLCVACADHICLSTEPLQAYVASRLATDSHLHYLHHAPNLIDIDDWSMHRSAFLTKPSFVNVLYASSNTHSRDIKEVEEALVHIRKAFKGRVLFHFFGYFPESLRAILWPKSCRHHDWVPLQEYPAMLYDIAPHIAICPLTDCEFNERKSDLKWMEMTMAGAAVIASAMPAYAAAGKRVANTTVDWHNALGTAIETTLAGHTPPWFEEDRVDIMSLHSWQSPVKERWMEFFRGIVQ